MPISKVKICGITQLDDALYALEQGASALGFVFYAPSSRYIDAEQAQAIIQQCPPFFTAVGLFVNADKKQVQSVLQRVKLSLLQFHGDEDDAFCAQFNLPYIKALRVRNTQDLVAHNLRFPNALAFLLDTYQSGQYGGTGKAFDWSLIPPLSKPIILAGGLTTENVAKAIAQVRPYAVDVSGGVEQSPGKKDKQKIQQFMYEVQHAERPSV